MLETQIMKPELQERIYAIIHQFQNNMVKEPVLSNEFWTALSNEFVDFEYNMDCGDCQATIIDGKTVLFYLEYRDTVMEYDPFIIRFIRFIIDDIGYSCE